MTKVKILTVVGARPQFIKAAPLSRLFQKHSTFKEILLHTGQHHDQGMSDIFFKELSIPEPVYHLGIYGGNHGQMTGKMLEKIEEILLSEKPHAVIVYGDTNSTLAGALAASKCHIPVIHIEAGLRSYNKKMPEEINRLLTDHVSSYLLCPTTQAIENLKKEGITKNIYKTGDIMFDATLYALEKIKNENNKDDLFKQLSIEKEGYALATLHRAENTDSPEMLKDLFDYLSQEGLKNPIVLPLHPRTRQRLKSYSIDFNNIKLIDPVGYFDMQLLLSEACQIYTDSGGLQKEAYFHQKPCVTLRTETEWVETITNGWNRLWMDPDYKPRKPIKDYGNGQSAAEILSLFEKVLL